MSRFAQIDLSQLPPPDVIEELSYDAVLADALGRMVQLLPEVETTLALESEPLRKMIELMSYIVLLLRARINDAAAATMLATARGADLDNLAALFGVQRLVITQATEDAEAIYESDDDLRARTQLAPEAYTTAGSIGAYEFHARTADARVRDVSVTSPEPGTVLVTVLGDDVSSGTPEDLLLAVQTALNEEQVRPLCDAVAVSAPELVEYQVDAVLTVGSGPDANVVLAAAQAAVAIYIADVQRLGATVARSGLLAALHRPGVIRVALSSPVADIECGATQAPVSTAVSVVLEGQA